MTYDSSEKMTIFGKLEEKLSREFGSQILVVQKGLNYLLGAPPTRYTFPESDAILELGVIEGGPQLNDDMVVIPFHEHLIKPTYQELWKKEEGPIKFHSFDLLSLDSENQPNTRKRMAIIVGKDVENCFRVEDACYAEALRMLGLAVPEKFMAALMNKKAKTLNELEHEVSSGRFREYPIQEKLRWLREMGMDKEENVVVRQRYDGVTYRVVFDIPRMLEVYCHF